MACFNTYIVTNPDRTTLYVGMTNDLRRPLIERCRTHIVDDDRYRLARLADNR
jgi:predicted GIY-YIG superfamily endonuclease